MIKKFIFTLLLLCVTAATPSFSYSPSFTDYELLQKIERDTLDYFIKNSDKMTGLTKDSSKAGSPSSVAATGFALAAYAIGASRGWLAQDYAQSRILITLDTLLNKAAHQEGFFFHFLDARTAKRVWGSEASSIDTALAVAGALLAAQYYPETEIEQMAHKIYNRVNWKWMMNGSDFICMGWTPEAKFLPYYWDSYNELMILVALAIGSPTNPIPPEAWHRWLRQQGDYNGHHVMFSSTGALFTYQFSHAYIDFRGLDDNGIDLFDNSVKASLANRDYSLSFGSKYKSYNAKSWGLSSSVGPGGYKAYGGKPGEGLQDGTVAPYATVSSIVFTPEHTVPAIRYFYETHGEKLYGKFGFKDAFNLDKKWWADEWLGIDQGISLLMLENYLNEEIVWKKFMALECVQNWIKLTGIGNKEKQQTAS